LLPLRPLLEQLRAGQGVRWLEFPSLLRWPALAGDRRAGRRHAGWALRWGCWRWRVRPAAVLRALDAAVPQLRGRLPDVPRFQWDNLLLECGLL
jgi:hypothetical protein